MSRVVNDQSDPPSDPDPMRKPAVDECDADRDDVAVEKDDLDGDGDLDFGQEDELQDAFKPEPIQMVESPKDGMPIPVDEQPSTQLNLAPSFTYENCVCIADDREYVELFVEELLQLDWTLIDTSDAVTPDGHGLVSVYPPGFEKLRGPPGFVAQRRYDNDGMKRQRQAWPKGEVAHGWGVPTVDRAGMTVPVRAKREQCKHYRRQVFAKRGIEQGEFGHYDLYRNCVARRSIGGAYLTIKDEAVYACEYRDPPDESSVAEHLDKHDDERLRAGPPEEIPLFGIT